MSPAASRIAPLRQQLADYDRMLGAGPAAYTRAQLGRLRRGRERVEELLRELSTALIAGGWHGC